ncbi:hypothetical protein D1B32_14695 [Oceanobacillus profundus]|uniref:Uncharacterized protein n=1 Tax=Oceanobacillus profundus TaxID=372463 RepID=A0A417YEG4_9BACI|nr:hypothetical protein D1B32_14695 [Oceanobacillus profundus]
MCAVYNRYQVKCAKGESPCKQGWYHQASVPFSDGGFFVFKRLFKKSAENDASRIEDLRLKTDMSCVERRSHHFQAVEVRYEELCSNFDAQDMLVSALQKDVAILADLSLFHPPF